MLKIALSGCNGRMGQVITRLSGNYPDIEITAGFDLNAQKLSSYPVYAHPLEFSGDADVCIDFSNPAALDALLIYGEARKIPLVLATTGYTAQQEEKVRAVSDRIAIFRSANMSLGVNVLIELVKRACAVLSYGYDIEIIEKHHGMKLDAPSGTAYMLADAAKNALPRETEYIYDRHERREKRSEKEIGIHSVRGGTIVGEHEVIFAGTDEIVSISHTAQSREVFANGALRAAIFMSTHRNPGLYSMEDVVRDAK